MEENKNILKNNKEGNINTKDSKSIDNEISEENFEINKKELNYDKSSNNLKNVSKRKMNLVITLDTVIYEIFNLNENKNRNYDRVSLEIKRIEQKNEIDKAKLRKKISQISRRINNKEILKIKEKDKIIEKEDDEDDLNDNDLNDDEIITNKLNLQLKKLEMLEFERDKKLNYIEVIQKLRKPPEQRTIRDILRIKTYVENSNFGKNFHDEFLDINIYEKLINFCCLEMRYQKFEKDDIIYKIGENPHSFYSIIFGTVNISKPIQKHEFLTGFQYFNYLMNMRKKKEIYIFNQCLKYNTSNYYIDPIHADIIHYIYLLNYLESIEKRNESLLMLDKVFDLIDIKPEDLGLNPSKINFLLYLNNNIKIIKRKLPPISEDTLQKYTFFDNYTIKKEVIIYEYKNISILKGNDYFGENDIENHTLRDSCAIAGSDIEVAYIPNKLYYNQIASLKAILLEKKINILFSNFFFKRINYNKFARVYFKLFKNEKYNKDDILFKEGEKINYLYFILEGSLQLYSTKSMNEIEELINILLEKKESFDNINIKNDQNNNDNYIYSQLNSDKYDLANYLNEKQQNKLMILNKNEDAGIISFLLGNNYLASCIISSNNAKIYKIDINSMNLMLRNEYECKLELYKRIKQKIGVISERLYELNNIKLIKIDNKLSLENKNKMKILEQENNNNKTFIDYDKIYNLLNDNNNCNNIYTNYNNRQKTETINLPQLSIDKKNNINSSIINNEESNNKNLKRKNIFNKKENNLSMNIYNQKYNFRKLKNNNIYEDNIILFLNNNIKTFIDNRYILSNENKKLINLFEESNNNNKSLKEINNIKDIKDKNNDLYITQIPNSYQKMRNEDNKFLNELISNSNNNNINTFPTSPVTKKFNLNKSIERTINIKRSKYFKSNNNSISYDLGSLSNDYKKMTLKKNKNKYIDKINNELRIINQGKNIKYNKPYYNNNILIKKERYKIFENSNLNKKIQSDYIKTHIQRIRDIKNLHSKFNIYK